MRPNFFWLAGALVFGASATFAQEDRAKLEWGLGAGVIASPRPYEGTKAQLFPVPVVTVKWGRWFFEGVRGGYELVSTRRITARALGQACFQGLEPEESAFLEGMAPRSQSMNAGAELFYRARPIGFRFVALTDVLGRSKGPEVSAQITSGAPLGRKLMLFVGFGPRWESSRRVDYYYGVRPSEALESRPAYAGTSTVSWDAGFSALYRPSSRWSVFLLVNRTAYGDGIRKSPIVARESATSLLVSFVHDFGSKK